MAWADHTAESRQEQGLQEADRSSANNQDRDELGQASIMRHSPFSIVASDPGAMLIERHSNIQLLHKLVRVSVHVPRSRKLSNRPFSRGVPQS